MRQLITLSFLLLISAVYGNVTLTTVYDISGQDLTLTDIAIDSKDNLWIAMTDEDIDKPCLYLYDDGKLNSQKCGSWGTSDVFIDLQDNIWFVDNEEHMYDGNQWTDLDGNNDPAYVLSVTSDLQGNTWIGNFYSVARYKGGEWEHFQDDKLGDFVKAMTTDLDGNMWLGTSEGVTMFDGENWESHLSDVVMAKHFISATLDAHGNVWFGTEMSGAFKYDGTTWTQYTEQDGLASDMVTAIVADKNGMVWISTNYGINSFDGSTWTKYSYDKDIKYHNNSIGNMVMDSNGDLWMVSSAGVEYVQTGGTGRFIPEGVTDSDNDGTPDDSDTFPTDPNEWTDSDNDGVGDNGDAFPNDATETEDTDGDGVGNVADVFPSDKTEWEDTDSDGIGNNVDVFPNDASEWLDTDNDGVGDNADEYPTDPTRYEAEQETYVLEQDNVRLDYRDNQIIIVAGESLSSYSIYNQLGQLIMTQKSNVIDLNTLKAGVYYVNILGDLIQFNTY